jgi:hypothetical protein
LELLTTVFALALLLRLARGRAALEPAAGAAASTFLAAYALVATLSLLLLPVAVLQHRVFLEGTGFGRAVLAAFPKDPLYPIASVNRLWLFVVFAGLLAVESDGRALYRRLFRGIAWSAIAAVVLGLLDFTGVLSLDRYNLSNLFYGARYRRRQSTSGNPSWFACFVACALPFALLEFPSSPGRSRGALAAPPHLFGQPVPVQGPSRSPAVLAAKRRCRGPQTRRRGRPGEARCACLGGAGSTVATVGLLVVAAIATPTTPSPGGGDRPPSRLEGLSRELQYRGLWLTSPRRVAAAYALELARLKPLLGLGYETYNLHLRAQLAIPGSGVASVVNTAVSTDATETVFDDSHSTYLQVLTGTGVLGLSLWLGLTLAGLGAAARVFRQESSTEAFAVLVALAVFHVYGLFQGMAYIPVTFFLLPLLLGYSVTLDPGSSSVPAHGGRRWGLAAAAALLLIAAAGYASDSGYASLKRRFGVSAYLPDEAGEFEGFYRPETGAAGEFRWMRERAIVNVRRTAPFRLSFTCEHPDLEREPVVLTLRFEGRDAGQVVFRRPGAGSSGSASAPARCS